MLGGIFAALLATAVADDAAAAKERFEAAEQHYQVGDFEKASDEYKEGYRLSHKPELLFNLGQAQKQLGKHKEAAFYFGQYLQQAPKAPNWAYAETMWREEKELADAPAVPVSPIVVVEEKTREVKVPVEVFVEKQWRPTRIAGTAVAGAAVVALGVGIVEGLHSRGVSSDLQASVQRNGGVYYSPEVARLDSAKGAAKAANVLFVSIGGLAAAGATLWLTSS